MTIGTILIFPTGRMGRYGLRTLLGIRKEIGLGRTRTGTAVTSRQILSLLCLPFHHKAIGRNYSLIFCAEIVMPSASDEAGAAVAGDVVPGPLGEDEQAVFEFD